MFDSLYQAHFWIILLLRKWDMLQPRDVLIPVNIVLHSLHDRIKQMQILL